MLAAMSNIAPPTAASYADRIHFLIELAERLHRYGTTAQRLEGAITATAQRLGVDCEPWSNPTGMILTFSDPLRPDVPAALAALVAHYEMLQKGTAS